MRIGLQGLIALRGRGVVKVGYTIICRSVFLMAQVVYPSPFSGIRIGKRLALFACSRDMVRLKPERESGDSSEDDGSDWVM